MSYLIKREGACLSKDLSVYEVWILPYQAPVSYMPANGAPADGHLTGLCLGRLRMGPTCVVLQRSSVWTHTHHVSRLFPRAARHRALQTLTGLNSFRNQLQYIINYNFKILNTRNVLLKYFYLFKNRNK